MPGKHILYTVLNWGLGHATRSIPVIRCCLEQGYRVSIASDGLPLDFLKNEFPDLNTYELPGYDITYQKGIFGFRAWKLMRKVSTAIKSEQARVATLHQEHHFDGIITDNRYGCFIRELPCAMITHQLQMVGAGVVGNFVATRKISQWLRPYDKIWVPDEDIDGLSGEMSEVKDQRVRHIGYLSTIGEENNLVPKTITCILSGPEPLRGELEEKVRSQLSKLRSRSVLVRGISGPGAPVIEGNMVVFNQLDRQAISKLLGTSEVVICRPGYSSLMDLQAAGKKAVLIPTPGQPEQEYLARRLANRPYYLVQNQKSVDLDQGVNHLLGAEDPPKVRSNKSLITSAVLNLLG